MTRYEPEDRDPFEQMWQSEYEQWEAEQDELFNEEMEDARD